MNLKIHFFIFFTIITIAVLLSRFTPVSDMVTVWISDIIRGTPISLQIEDNIFKPYYTKEEQINQLLIEFRNKYDLAAAGILVFHTENLEKPIDSNYFFSILYETVRPGQIATHYFIRNVPISTVPNFLLKTLNKCNGGEIGGPTSSPVFLNLPERPSVLCAVNYQQQQYGMVYMVDFYERRSLNELVELTPELEDLSDKVTKIINS